MLLLNSSFYLFGYFFYFILKFFINTINAFNIPCIFSKGV